MHMSYCHFLQVLGEADILRMPHYKTSNIGPCVTSDKPF